MGTSTELGLSAIASQALARGLVVVTDNVGEFTRVKGLKVENWRVA